MLSRAEEVSLWLWWNYHRHGGKKPGNKVIEKAKLIAKENQLSDEVLDEIYVRWSSTYMPRKVE